HIRDIGKAIVCALEAPREAIHNETFNVGDTANNYRVRNVAEIIAEVFEDCVLEFGPPDADQRSYRVSCDKINARLPGFACDWDAEQGARELRDLFEQIELDEARFTHRNYTRLAQLKHLIETGRLDEHFFWKPPAPR
ncbi:MAG: NAD-dependent dehydratase, partial [Verrucomicrobiota bacterium]